jgi:hypothetical protein
VSHHVDIPNAIPRVIVNLFTTHGENTGIRAKQIDVTKCLRCYGNQRFDIRFVTYIRSDCQHPGFIRY